MTTNQLSIFDQNWSNINPSPETTKSETTKDITINISVVQDQTSILISALASDIISEQLELIATLAKQPEAKIIAQSLGNSQLVRKLNTYKSDNEVCLSLETQGNKVFYKSEEIGKIQILYKSPLPGELQARLAYESIIDRFLEYLQKKYYILALQESDYHLQVFIPANQNLSFKEAWKDFIQNVAFSIYGDSQNNLPGLIQTFISMLNTVTLAGRGFSTLDIPIITEDQSKILAAWYLAVFEQVKKRQEVRQKQINDLEQLLNENHNLTDKERNSKQKELQQKQEMQAKEAKKYSEYFSKTFTKILEEHQPLLQELALIDSQLQQSSLTKSQIKKLTIQRDKILAKMIFSQDSVNHKLKLLAESEGDPFEFIKLDKSNVSEIFNLSTKFSKTATEQINSTRGDIFAQCLLEMYKLLENNPNDKIPQPLLSEKLRLMEVRSLGDDGKDFCYSCGVALDKKKAQWQVARFMFERPSQRLQSSSSETRPYICSCCSVLAFASPLKVTDDSIILKLEYKDKKASSQLKIKEYLRMLTNKEMHLNSGKYIILHSDQTNKGDVASQKLGQVQYSLAKVASIFPLEVLTDFKFSLILQGSQSKYLPSRHLIFIKGLMTGYSQNIINSGKEINLKLGDAIRYVEQDLPYLAEYTIVKVSNFNDFSSRLFLEQIRQQYYQLLSQELRGDSMNQNQLQKRANLYKDVAALTGLTSAFAQSLESTAKKATMKQEDVEREVSKLIEKVEDPVAFCYFATLGDEKKTSVQARLFHNPDNDFIYQQLKLLLTKLELTDRENQDDQNRVYLQLYADDINRAYTYFSENDYAQEKDWKQLTYNLKLSLYTRFPELVRKLKSKGDQ